MLGRGRVQVGRSSGGVVFKTRLRQGGVEEGRG